jgi:hypothetical protein
MDTGQCVIVTNMKKVLTAEVGHRNWRIHRCDAVTGSVFGGDDAVFGGEEGTWRAKGGTGATVFLLGKRFVAGTSKDQALRHVCVKCMRQKQAMESAKDGAAADTSHAAAAPRTWAGPRAWAAAATSAEISVRVNKSFAVFFSAYIDLVLNELDSADGWGCHDAEPDLRAFEDLKAALCTSTNEGECVSFEVAAGRRGYIRSCLRRRAGYAPFLCAISSCPAVAALRALLLKRRTLSVASIGGGPGLEAVGLSAFLLFFGDPKGGDQTLKVANYDYEVGNCGRFKCSMLTSQLVLDVFLDDTHVLQQCWMYFWMTLLFVSTGRVAGGAAPHRQRH